MLNSEQKLKVTDTFGFYSEQYVSNNLFRLFSLNHKNIITIFLQNIENKMGCFKFVGGGVGWWAADTNYYPARWGWINMKRKVWT